MFNRVGLTLEEAREQRPPIEVEALLLSQIAQREVMREETQDPRHKTIENRVGEAAPGWVDSLPVEEG